MTNSLQHLHVAEPQDCAGKFFRACAQKSCPSKKFFWCKLIYNPDVEQFSQLRLQLVKHRGQRFYASHISNASRASGSARIQAPNSTKRGQRQTARPWPVYNSLPCSETGTGMHSFSWSCMSAAGLALSTKAKLQRIHSCILCCALLSAPHALLFLFLIFLS